MKAEIATHQAKYTLVQLHAELAGKILDNKREALRLRQAMIHVEAVLKLLDPDYNLARIAIRRKEHNGYFKRGTMFRHAIDVMRRANAPLTCREIVERMLAAQGVTKPALKDIRILVGGVQSSLRNNEGKTVFMDGKMPARWRLRA
jgi:hypothetical protein